MIKNELQHIIRGTSKDSCSTLVETTADYLRRSEKAGALAKNDKHRKQKVEKILIKFCNENNFWADAILNFNLFVSKGAEQKVYIKDDKTVYKLNDAIYYSRWIDYFVNLQLNNFYFPETSYKLIGFCLIDKTLYALVEQPFVKSNPPTNFAQVKEFMYANGFVNTRNHDYYNQDLVIIFEDLHDENVLTQNGVLYFIDTIFLS